MYKRGQLGLNHDRQCITQCSPDVHSSEILELAWPRLVSLKWENHRMPNFRKSAHATPPSPQREIDFFFFFFFGLLTVSDSQTITLRIIPTKVNLKVAFSKESHHFLYRYPTFFFFLNIWPIREIHRILQNYYLKNSSLVVP